MTTIDPETAWRAVAERDGRFDERFVYAVTSTGVFCRPTCPSRRPRRERVRFFAEPHEAEAAGFRACKRCRPRRGEASRASEAVASARRFLEAHAGERVTLAELSREAGMSVHHLQRTFKAALGVSPKQYALALRAARLKADLRGGASVTSALHGAGYGSSSRLYEQADRHLGMTPATYRRGGEGVQVGYTVVDSRFGRLLVAATGRGLCSVMLGDDDERLARALRDEYPNAQLAADTPDLRLLARRVLEHVEGADSTRAPQLDVQGTAFQREVWGALQRIPRGETRSYHQVAESIGRLDAARAVARACATNPVALVVPCHRVVRADGSAGGYRWGARRKRLLLAAEAAGSEARAGRP